MANRRTPDAGTFGASRFAHTRTSYRARAYSPPCQEVLNQVGKYPNVVPIKRGGKIICYRARLVFPFDSELGYKPKPIHFFGATEREAHAKRAAYKPESTPNETTPLFLKTSSFRLKKRATRTANSRGLATVTARADSNGSLLSRKTNRNSKRRVFGKSFSAN